MPYMAGGGKIFKLFSTGLFSIYFHAAAIYGRDYAGAYIMPYMAGDKYIYDIVFKPICWHGICWRAIWVVAGQYYVDIAVSLLGQHSRRPAGVMGELPDRELPVQRYRPPPPYRYPATPPPAPLPQPDGGHFPAMPHTRVGRGRGRKFSTPPIFFDIGPATKARCIEFHRHRAGVMMAVGE
jgi:hypothetical protein